MYKYLKKLENDDTKIRKTTHKDDAKLHKNNKIVVRVLLSARASCQPFSPCNNNTLILLDINVLL